MQTRDELVVQTAPMSDLQINHVATNDDDIILAQIGCPPNDLHVPQEDLD